MKGVLSLEDKIYRYFNSLKDKRVSFIGIGRSNIPAIELFVKYGACVTACDKRKREDFVETVQHLENIGAHLKLGPSYLDDIDADMVFRTPGMNYHSLQLLNLRENGVIVTSEMELFFKLCPCKIIAVSGSDGKTTTTTIVSEMLKKQGKKVFLGGNIGRPLLPQIFEISCDDIAVIELSSFQLISMRKSPDIAVLTNISPNHLDVHKDMDEYINAKKNIFLHQDAESKTVLNLDDKICSDFHRYIRGKKCFFSTKQKPRFGAFVKNGILFISENNIETELFSEKDIKIPGKHNTENFLAACTALHGIVSVENMKAVALNFAGVAHRLEFVRNVDGVEYYNDAIATSPTRCIKGALSIYDDKKITMIAGGYDKNLAFDSLAKAIVKKVKHLILMGDTALSIEKAVRECDDYHKDLLKISHAKNMLEAVKIAKINSCAGDKVYMSPACASFDMYKDFEAKGNDFKNIVNSL